MVAVVAAVANPTKELLIGFNEDSHSGRQFIVGGSEGGIRFNQFLQYPLLCGGSRSKDVEIFVKVVSLPWWTICLMGRGR